MLRKILPDYLYDKDKVDKTHFHHRRKTKLYKKKQNVIKNVWLFFGVSFSIFTPPLFIIATFLFGLTFMSFSILDEME